MIIAQKFQKTGLWIQEVRKKSYGMKPRMAGELIIDQYREIFETED